MKLINILEKSSFLRKIIKNLWLRNVFLTFAIIFGAFTYVSSLIDEGSKGYYIFKNLFEKKFTYLSNAEQEVHNEWVVRVNFSSTKNEAFAKLNELKQAIISIKYPLNCTSKDGCWTDNLHVVRDICEENLWLVVADVLAKRSSMDETRKKINQIIDFSNTSVKLSDTIGTLLTGSIPYDYRLDLLESTYGQIANYPEDYYYTKVPVDAPKIDCGSINSYFKLRRKHNI